MSKASTPRLSPQHTLVLPIPPRAWPPPPQAVTLDGLVFVPKRELHITLIGSVLGRELRAAVAGPLDAAIAAALAAQDWRFARSGRLLRLQKSIDDDGSTQTVGSIIELVDLPAMAPFHAALSRLLGRPLPVPPAHVTLYTQGSAKGISVPGAADLQRLTVRAVAAAELQAS
ncbi:hypothetical protein [Cognatiluteimonas profundi]|uniref:hypothetical protein n=1 Tax=Cognatiluteimonas profundi TaxID=2594501 RepID=UPI00131D7908|nr:hypothetical protein [Lysobacter profundi]